MAPARHHTYTIPVSSYQMCQRRRRLDAVQPSATQQRQDRVHVHKRPSPACLPTSSLAISSFSMAPTTMVHNLGIYTDSNLSMRGHIRRTVSCCFAVLRKLRTIRRRIPTAVFQSLIVALLLPRLDYCNSVLYGLPAYLIRHFQSVQNAAAWLYEKLAVQQHFSYTVL